MRHNQPIPTTLTLEDLRRFWSKVEITDNCWLWTAGTRSGYGTIKMGGKKGYDFIVSRLMFAMYTGVDPGESLVCHHCDVPTCVRPDHLFAGTDGDNNADKTAKGRAARKLSIDKAVEISKLARRGHLTQYEIAAIYGVQHSTISEILNGKTWKHATGNENRKGDGYHHKLGRPPKLSIEQAEDGHRRWMDGETLVSIGRDFGVTGMTVKLAISKLIHL